MGKTKEEATQVACVLLFGPNNAEYGGKVIPIAYSTKMPMKTFSKLIEKDIEICNFLGIQIPHIER